MNLTDDILREAAEAVEKAMVDALPAADVGKHQFSKRFERKMRRLIRAQAHPRRSLLLKRAAAIFLALLVGASTWLAVDQEARAAFFQWVREVYEESVVYRFLNPGTAAEDVSYTLGWLPDGYVEGEAVVTDEMTIKQYQNSDGDIVHFIYMKLSADTHLQVMLEGASYAPIEVAGITGEFYLSGDSSIASELVWVDEEKGMVFIVSSTLNQNTILKMAESIT